MQKVEVFRVNGESVDVPEAERAEFEAAAKGSGAAVEPVSVYRTPEGEVFEVPESERVEFENTAGERAAAFEPVRTVRVGQETVEVPEGEREEFLKAYRESPKFAAEREADRARVAREAGDPGSVVGAVLRGAAEGVVQAPRWWRETLEVLPQNFREGVNQATAMGADGDAALGVLSAEEADAAQAAYREKAAKQGEDDTARRWFAEAAKMAGQQVQPLAAAAGAAGAVGLAAGASGVGAPSAVPAGMCAGAVTLAYGFYRQAAGEIYREARDQGLEHGTARAVALAAAVPFAALEKFQLTRLAQGLARRSVKGALVRRVAAELGAAGVRTVQEAAAEGAQETLKRAGVSAARVIDGELAAAALPRQLRDDFMAGVEEFGATLGPMAVMQVPGAVGGTAWQVVRERDAVRREGEFLRDALGESTGAAAEAERAAAGRGTDGGDGNAQRSTFNSQRSTGETEGGRYGKDGTEGAEPAAGAGGAGGEGAAAAQDIYGAGAGEEVAGGAGETPNAQRSTPNAKPETLSVTVPNARIAGLAERKMRDGSTVPGVRLELPEGKMAFSYDPGEIALAEYLLRDRGLFPKKPAMLQSPETGREEAADPYALIARRAGFGIKPGKRLLVNVGRSIKPYPATVVDVLDGTHVRVKIDNVRRAAKNNRAGYADIDVRQTMQFKAAEVKAAHEKELRAAFPDPADRLRARRDARQFMDLLLAGDELVDQRALALSGELPRREGGVLRSNEIRDALYRAAAALGTDEDLTTPAGRAKALPALEAWLEKARTGSPGWTPEMWQETLSREAEAEAARIEPEPFAFDSMTADEMIAEERRVAEAAERVERRRELERRAAAGISGTAGDMTGTLPGMEGTSDVPLFTEQGLGDGGRRTEGGVLANEEPGAAAARLATPGDQPGSVGGVRVTPHTVYNQDGSAGMEGEGRTVAPVADGLQGVGMDLRDAVSLYRELRGLVPRIRKSLNGRALGWYKVKGREIELLASIFGLVDSRDAAVIRERLAHKGLTPEEVEAQVPAEINALVEIRRNSRMKMPVKVLTHELGHLVDALPDGMLRGRGNILGHVAALHRYMKQTLPRAPGEAGEVSGEEKARLWSEAEKMAERDLGKAREWVEEIRAEVKGLERVPVSAEDIKGILGLDGRERTPELYAWFARQDDGTKKDILKKAMKGLVDERAEGGAVREVLRTVVTGTRIRTEKTYSRADVSKRFRELLRKAVEDLRLIERDAIVAEARAAIPLWRGVEAAEKYFERPEEMYAELFGMFLSDPGWMEKNVPTAFRAYVAYMDARPEAAKAYRLWLNDKQNGTAEKKHVDRLKEAWAARAEDDLAKLEHLRKKATAAQEWQGFRYFLDRRMGPVYAATRTLARLARTDIARRVAAGETDRGAAGAELAALERRTDGIAAGVKDVLHHQNTIRLMLADVRGRVSGPLRDAGLDWTQLAEFAFHNRVRYELDGRAAAFGWSPETSGRRLEEMRAGMTEAQWEALGGAWLEFRGIYERAVVEMDGMREMLGEELHDLIRKNVHYVAFAHVPTAEEVRMTLEEREAAGADAKAAGLREYDGVTAFDLVAAEIERRGGAAGAKIYALTGSFDPVADPLTATLEKAGRMVNAVYQNRLKLALRDFARDTPGSGYREAETGTRKGGEKYLREVDDGRFKTLHYMEGGELKAFVTDKWVAEAFEGGRGDRLAAVGTLMKVNNLISAMYTRLRIGFFEPAYMKDKQAVAANMKGLWRSPLASVPFLGETPLAFVTRYIPEGVRDRLPAWLMNRHMLEWYEGQARRVAILIERGDFDAQLRRAAEAEGAGNRRAAERMRAEVYWARRALGMNVLMAMQDVILPGQGLSAYERMNAKHGVRLDRETAAAEGFLAKHGKGMATAFVEWYARLGEIRENTTKIAALMYLDETSDMSEEQKKVAVSEFGGSPDFSERGVAAGYFEFMQGAFINARKEGLVRSFKAFAANPGDYLSKKMVYTVSPAAVRWMVRNGVFLGLLRAMVPEDEREGNPVYGFLEWALRKMSFVSDYLQKSYAVIPLPVDAGENCAVVLTLPMDETERAWNDLTCSALDSLTEALGGDVSKDPDPWLNAAGRVFGEFMPFAANGGPMLSAIMPWLNTYGLGRPTYDSFRQRNVLTDDELAARYSRPDAVQALLGNTWNALGGGTVKAWERDKPQVNKMVPVEEFLRWPVIQPVVGRFVRVVRGGQEQIVKTIGAEDEAARITDRLDAKRILVESMKQGVPLLPEYRERVTSNPYILDYYFEAYEKQFGKAVKDPFLEAAAKSSSPETAMRLMRKRSELGL